MKSFRVEHDLGHIYTCMVYPLKNMLKTNKDFNNLKTL